MRKSVFFLSAFLVLALASPSSAEGKPKLKLKAPRTIFMKPTGMYSYSPVSVMVRAELEGDPQNPEEYYCLVEEWEWGDETESSHEPDCEPYVEGAELTRFYSASHTYRIPGNYTIFLRLQSGKRSVLTGSITVNLRGT